MGGADSPSPRRALSVSPLGRTDPAGRPLRDRFKYVEVSLRSRSPGPAGYHPTIGPKGERSLGESGMKTVFHGSKKTILEEIQARSMSPGPTYSPQQLSASGARGFDSPSFSFGSRSPLKGRFPVPGPGTYQSGGCFGRQPVSKGKQGTSMPTFSFGGAERKTVEIPRGRYPGPGEYSLGSLIGARSGKFGHEERKGPRDLLVPGPGTYPIRSQIGSQPESIKESSSSWSFSKADGMQEKRGRYMGRDLPPPNGGCGADRQYDINTSSHGKQVLGTKKSGASYSF